MKNKIRILLLCIIFLVSGINVSAQDADPVDQKVKYPRWIISVAGAYFVSNMKTLSPSFSDGAPYLAASVGLRFLSFWDIQLEGGVIAYQTQLRTITGREATGEASLYLFPLRLSSIVRFMFSPRQWLIPYIGGGLDYVAYQQSWEMGKNRGDRLGFHIRSGLQFFLNPLEPDAAMSLYGKIGIRFSYFFVEGIYSQRDDFYQSADDLGGWEIRSGVALYY